MHNLYYPVYKNLENEVIDLAYKIHFTDDQLDVYSIKIAELLVRCCVEIEAISKDLYLSNGGNPEPLDENGKKRDLYFDTDCLAYLDSKWLLSKKIVYTSSPNFYFTKEENKTLTPLKNVYKRKSTWGKAYQAVKHNRSQNIKFATVKNLIHGMAALYLLNIYYMDGKPKFIGNIAILQEVDMEESALFYGKIAPSLFCFTRSIIGIHYDDSVYLEKITDIFYRELLVRLKEAETNDKQNEFYRDAVASWVQAPKELIVNKKQYIYPAYFWE